LEADVDGTFLVLGALTLAVGAIGIANTTIVSVLERTSELGLRRALGATRLDIAAQILAETALLGLASGVIGTSAGVCITTAVAAVRDWSAVLDPTLALLAPLGSALLAVVAGAFPAHRASRIEPIAALRA
jgi:putative ABC transport system permease protein